MFKKIFLTNLFQPVNIQSDYQFLYSNLISRAGFEKITSNDQETIIANSIKIHFKNYPLIEKYTIVHCIKRIATSVRIWPTTFLVQDNGEKKKLVAAYNISKYPNWEWIEADHQFTLVFEGLDKECKTFDLLEDIPEPGGFEVNSIVRNCTDVYSLKI